MIKRSAVMGIGLVLLVICMAGLALWQTEVVYRPASKGQIGPLDVKPQVPSQEGSGSQAGLERRELPGPADGINQTPGPGSQTEHVPAPQSVEGPRTPRPAVPAGDASGTINQRSAGNGVGEQGLKSGDLAAEKAILVPQAVKGEEQGQTGPQGTAGPGAETTRNPSLALSKAPSRPSPEALQPVVIRFHFDPAEKREINVAQVHLGDSISLRVQRLGQANLGLHLAFTVPDTFETDAWREWSTGPKRTFVAPIQDNDRIALTADRDFGVALTRKLDSKEGAVLKLGTNYPHGPAVQSLRPERWGGYEIEMRIYPGNRWNIKPRGLL
ncbi:MAG: hypothetical protein ABSF52_14445 [Syntrophobacteraceae bacterium]